MKATPTPMQDAVSDALHRVLDLRARQHATIVSNLANADTPGYRARRLDFRDALAEVAARASGPGAAALPGAVPGEFQAAVRVEYEEPPPWSADGNSVDAEQETMLLNENNVVYGAVAEVLRRKFASLEYAIRGGLGG